MDRPRMRDPRNEDDFDTWEYGTEPLPDDKTWTRQAALSRRLEELIGRRLADT
jgi:hypothetical protein